MNEEWSFQTNERTKEKCHKHGPYGSHTVFGSHIIAFCNKPKLKSLPTENPIQQTVKRENQSSERNIPVLFVNELVLWSNYSG